MAPVYVSLSTAPDDDNEELLLAKSNEDFSSFRAQKPSPKVLLMGYILVALGFFFAATNIAAGVRALRTYHGRHAAIDTLPRPNIFVGLPKNPKTGKHKSMSHEQAHAHNHSHSHSNCESVFLMAWKCF